jgi:DNA polymerase III epsilon subunit-like protein
MSHFPFLCLFAVASLRNTWAWECLMQEFSWGWGRWSDWHQSYRYISLKGACSILGIERSDQAHRALGDCQAALATLRALVAKNGSIDLEAPPAHVPGRVQGRARWTTREIAQPVPVIAGSSDDFDPFLDSDELP